MDKKDITEIIKTRDINWIQIHFTDILGELRVLHIPAHRFLEEDILAKGFDFDGSSVGFRKVEKSDMIARPDPTTFKILPHLHDEAMVHADLFDTKLNVYRAGPRNILKKAVMKAKDSGFDFIWVSPEMEFYAFNDSTRLEAPQSESSYFIPPPRDNAKEYRKHLSNALIENDYDIKYHHHEAGAYQHEVEITGLEAVAAADFSVYFKFLAHEIASLHDLEVTFMPKPISDEAGNGMHVHMGLYKDGNNMFLDTDEPYNLSQTARYFIGGILEHAPGLAALGNPTLNSYKRLIPHFEAPMYIAWARYNRSSLIRIPAKKNVDVEIRHADPSANPYLFFAALIHAGLDGIKNKISYEPIMKNIYTVTEKEIQEQGIQRLPKSLMEALEEFERDPVLYEGIGEDAGELYIKNKTQEWNDYTSEITDLDYQYYFYC